MTRVSKVLIAAAAMFAVPVQTALAQDKAPPVEGETPIDGPVPGEGPPVDGVTASAGGVMSKSIIDRKLYLNKGKLGARADLGINHKSETIAGMTSSTTSELLSVGAGYGVMDKLEVGASYGFSLNEFNIKGPLGIYGVYSVLDQDKLSVAASANLVFDLSATSTNTAGMMEDTIHFTLDLGASVRYKLTPKMAVFTGNPYTPGPAGNQLSLGFSDGTDMKFSLPVGFAFQATPELYTYLETTIFGLLLSEPPSMGSRTSFIFADQIPVTLGAFYNITKNIDAGAQFIVPDLPDIGDELKITVGARYYN